MTPGGAATLRGASPALASSSRAALPCSAPRRRSRRAATPLPIHGSSAAWGWTVIRRSCASATGRIRHASARRTPAQPRWRPRCAHRASGTSTLRSALRTWEGTRTLMEETRGAAAPRPTSTASRRSSPHGASRGMPKTRSARTPEVEAPADPAEVPPLPPARAAVQEVAPLPRDLREVRNEGRIRLDVDGNPDRNGSVRRESAC